MAERRRLHIVPQDGWYDIEDADTYERVRRLGSYGAAEQVMLDLRAAEKREAKEALAKLLDDEGYGAWVDTGQLVDTLRQHRSVVELALKDATDD